MDPVHGFAADTISPAPCEVESLRSLLTYVTVGISTTGTEPWTSHHLNAPACTTRLNCSGWRIGAPAIADLHTVAGWEALRTWGKTRRWLRLRRLNLDRRYDLRQPICNAALVVIRLSFK